MKSTEETTEMCLKEMFKRVGLEYPNPEITNQPEWYHLYSWTESEQDDFGEWMGKLILKRHSFYRVYKKKVCERKVGNWVGMFILNWGWKVK